MANLYGMIPHPVVVGVHNVLELSLRCQNGLDGLGQPCSRGKFCSTCDEGSFGYRNSSSVQGNNQGQVIVGKEGD